MVFITKIQEVIIKTNRFQNEEPTLFILYYM